MDLASLQSGRTHLLNSSDQSSPADSPCAVGSSLGPGQTSSGLPSKAIGERWCVIERYRDSQRVCFDVRLDTEGSGDDHLERPPTVPQEEPEPQANDDDGPWQMVTRRGSKNKRQQTFVDAQAENASTENITLLSQSPEKGAEGMTGHDQLAQVCGKDSVSLSAITPDLYWPICSSSFARLSEVDWSTFRGFLMKFRDRQHLNISRNDFLHFQQLMHSGPGAMMRTDQIVALAAPFKVLLSEPALSPDTIFLSLLFEQLLPGFLNMLGAHFVGGLTGINHSQRTLFPVVAELLARLCREHPRWLDRLGWQGLSMRHQCNLFASISFYFKPRDKSDLIQGLQQQVSRAWLEDCYFTAVHRFSRTTARCDPNAHLRDIKASIRAIFCWLENQFFVVGKTEERPGLIVCFADACESLLAVTGRFSRSSTELEFSLWVAVATWSVYFRKYLRVHLGFDRAIALLDDLLQQIHRWPELDNLAFELRLTLLETTLMKCEELLLKRDSALFSHAWRHHEGMLELLLDRCNRFMKDFQPVFAVDSQSDFLQRKEEARLTLLLRESAFYRLDCEVRRTPRQVIQENLQNCHNAFTRGWGSSEFHWQNGTIELAKWYFLAEEHDSGVSCLMKACFTLFSLSWRKADLLARHGVYQAAVDEYHRAKSLLADQTENNRRKRDEIDDRIAMTLLRQFLAEHDMKHLVTAYRLSISLLGRCDIDERGRFQGGLCHIVNVMRTSGLKFEDYVAEASVLGYLVKDGCGIKSWRHFADLLHIRHKLGMADADTVDKVAGEVGGKHAVFLELGKKQ